MYFQILILEIVKRAKVVDWPPLDCQPMLGHNLALYQKLTVVKTANSALSVCVQASDRGLWLHNTVNTPSSSLDNK